MGISLAFPALVAAEPDRVEEPAAARAADRRRRARPDERDDGGDERDEEHGPRERAEPRGVVAEQVAQREDVRARDDGGPADAVPGRELRDGEVRAAARRLERRRRRRVRREHDLGVHGGVRRLGVDDFQRDLVLAAQPHPSTPACGRRASMRWVVDDARRFGPTPVDAVGGRERGRLDAAHGEVGSLRLATEPAAARATAPDARRR